jgi:hypothetical protein
VTDDRKHVLSMLSVFVSSTFRCVRLFNLMRNVKL